MKTAEKLSPSFCLAAYFPRLSGFTGKQFVKDATGATSCEISFGTLPPGTAVPFFHSHKANEENYIILFCVLAENEATRFNEIGRAIPDISPKVLTETLKSLEADGLISRKLYAEIPPKVSPKPARITTSPIVW